MNTVAKTCVFFADERQLGADNLIRFVSFPAAAARAHPAQASDWIHQRLKFLTRAWLHPRYTRAWLARLAQPDLSVPWALRPRLATKLQRPYLCRQWEAPERCAALLGHYEVLPHLLAPAVLAAIYKSGVSLLRIMHTDSNLLLDVRLFYQDQFEKEGELTLAIEDTATGLMLAGLTFSLVQNAGQRTLIIGGVQGSPDPRARDLIRNTAKNMHGLRAKALAFWCIQELATCWEVFQIQAVSDEQHVYRHHHKRRKIAVSYDEFWAESGGHRFLEGGWDLPRHMRERCREELKSSRRRAHEQRYLFLNTLRTNLHRNIAALAPGNFHPEFSSKETELFVYTTSATEALTRRNSLPSECVLSRTSG